MNWLTTDQIQKAAKKSRKAALECSREHWRQLSEATAWELRTHVSALTPDYEALCYWTKEVQHESCSSCPLEAAQQRCQTAGALFRKAYNAWESWFYDNGPWSAWKRAAKAMHKKLCDVK